MWVRREAENKWSTHTGSACPRLAKKVARPRKEWRGGRVSTIQNAACFTGSNGPTLKTAGIVLVSSASFQGIRVFWRVFPLLDRPPNWPQKGKKHSEATATTHLPQVSFRLTILGWFEPLGWLERTPLSMCIYCVCFQTFYQFQSHCYDNSRSTEKRGGRDNSPLTNFPWKCS